MDGFHQYGWGTDRAAVSEASSSLPDGTTNSGLDYWYADVVLFSNPGQAAFFFTRNGSLAAGRYSFQLTVNECERVYEQFRDALDSAYPTLRRTEAIPSRNTVESRVYDSRCEFFVYNDDSESWGANWINPATGAEEIQVRMQAVDLTPVLVVHYNGPLSLEIDKQRERADAKLLGPIQPPEAKDLSHSSLILNGAALDDVPLCSIRFSNVAELFGSPSTVEGNERGAGTFGAHFIYETSGFRILFSTLRVNPDPKLLIILFYFHPFEDSVYDLSFDAFPGSVVPDLSVSDPEAVKKLLSEFGRTSQRQSVDGDDIFEATSNEVTISVAYANDSQVPESVAVRCPAG